MCKLVLLWYVGFQVVKPVPGDPGKCEFIWLMDCEYKGWIPNSILVSAANADPFWFYNGLNKYSGKSPFQQNVPLFRMWQCPWPKSSLSIAWGNLPRSYNNNGTIEITCNLFHLIFLLIFFAPLFEKFFDNHRTLINCL